MRRPAVFLALVLFVAGVSLVAYRILWLAYPVFPAAPGKAWQLSFDARVKSFPEKEGMLAIGLPQEQTGGMVMEERIQSGSLSFVLSREGINRQGVWKGVGDPEGEEVNYQTTFMVRPGGIAHVPPPSPGSYPPGVGKEEQALAERIVGPWIPLPPSERIREVAAGQDLPAWKEIREKLGPVRALLTLFRAARIPAEVVEGLRLAEEIRTNPLVWIRAWNGKRWEVVWPGAKETARNPDSFFPLAIGGTPAARMSEGELSDVRWSLNRDVVSSWDVHFERIRRSGHFLDRWSLFHLPLVFQQTFRILLLVPIGALIISALRNLVGFPTFGIFMPVLMALAFRTTGLAYGLGIFLGILLMGYGVRRWMDRLRLLLVPRMSVILTLVVLCFTVLALVGEKIGRREFMAVGLLPFVILTMVIERFFVIVEEAGVREGLQTAAGSAAVAVIAYAIIGWEPLQLTFFVYPELLAPVAALQILLGRYTGYRLSELLRFRAMGSSG